MYWVYNHAPLNNFNRVTCRVKEVSEYFLNAKIMEKNSFFCFLLFLSVQYFKDY